jgi:hypothetical protein
MSINSKFKDVPEYVDDEDDFGYDDYFDSQDDSTGDHWADIADDLRDYVREER